MTVRPRSRPRWRSALRIAWLLLVLVAVAVVLADRWDEVRDEVARASAAWLAVSALLAAVGVGCSALVWRALLAGLGSQLPHRAALRVFFVGQLGKYLPGSVWPVLVQTELGRDHAVPARASVAAVVLFLLTHLLTGAAVAAVALPAAGALPWAVALLAAPALAMLAPALLGRLVRLALRVTRRQPLESLPDRGAILRAVGWAALMWGLYGLHLATVLVAFGQPSDPALAAGAFAAAWCAGFLFVIAPAGAGVREAVMVSLLLTQAPAAAALAAALLSRLLVTVADVGWGLAGLTVRGARAGERT